MTIPNHKAVAPKTLPSILRQADLAPKHSGKPFKAHVFILDDAKLVQALIAELDLA